MRFVDVSEKTKKKLKKFRSDKAIIEGFLRALKEIKTVPDPTTIGERKHGLYANCYGIHLTKNHSLVLHVYSKRGYCHTGRLGRSQESLWQRQQELINYNRS
ncbi:MAG: hypothetical protein KGI07_09300 [Thaumarchaeota archaeon]|nr:hypothetical protein [Nitrososphaerota archaeon]